MKKIILCLCGAFYLQGLYAQVGSDYGYSVDVRAYSLMQLPKLLNQTNSQDYSESYFKSAFIKFNDNQLSYRIGGYFNRQNITFDNQCAGCLKAEGKESDYFVKLGFEKNFNYSVVQPYLGVDLGYRAHAFTGVVRNVQAGSTAPDYNVESNKNGGLISPLIGLKANVLPRVTIFAEANLDFYYAYERRETTDVIVGSPTNFNRFTRMEYLLNPLLVGLQVHFGKKN